MREIIDRLQAKAREQKYRLTFHAEKEREADRILRQEIEEAVASRSIVLTQSYGSIGE